MIKCKGHHIQVEWLGLFGGQCFVYQNGICIHTTRVYQDTARAVQIAKEWIDLEVRNELTGEENED